MLGVRRSFKSQAPHQISWCLICECMPIAIQEQQKKEEEERKRKEQEAAEEAARKEAEERLKAAEAEAEAERKAAEQKETEERERIEEQKSKELAQIQVMVHEQILRKVQSSDDAIHLEAPIQALGERPSRSRSARSWHRSRAIPQEP